MSRNVFAHNHSANHRSIYQIMKGSCNKAGRSQPAEELVLGSMACFTAAVSLAF